MTSTLANNTVSSKLGREYFLECTKEGIPLQGQIPETVEYYAGAGGVSVVPEGKNVFYVSGALGTGALNVNLTNTQNYNNFIGRRVLFYNGPQAANNLTIDITGGSTARAFRLTGDTGDIATITPGGYAELHFIDTVNCLIGANAGCTTA